MKKIAKVLLTLGVLLIVPAGLLAGPTLVSCFFVVPTPFNGVLVISQDVPSEAVGALEAAGWVCPDPCVPDPECGV